MYRKKYLDYIVDIDYEGLDAGIREAVMVLAKAGVEPFASCEGGPGHPYPEPTIRFEGEFYEGYRAIAIALQHGLDARALRRVWEVQDNELVGPFWELILWKGKKERLERGQEIEETLSDV